ncbi:MAG: DUF1810 family protein [Bacteroidia bacterium]
MSLRQEILVYGRDGKVNAGCDKKLKSSMTLFSQIEDTNPVFKLVLDKFFDSNPDRKTIEISIGG